MLDPRKILAIGKSGDDYFLSDNEDWIPAVENLVVKNPNLEICLVGNCFGTFNGTLSRDSEVLNAYMFPAGTTPPTAMAVLVRTEYECEGNHSERIVSFSELGLEWRVMNIAQAYVRVLALVEDNATKMEMFDAELRKKCGVGFLVSCNLFLIGHKENWRLNKCQQIELGDIRFEFQNPNSVEGDIISDYVNADTIQNDKRFDKWAKDFLDGYDLDERFISEVGKSVGLAIEKRKILIADAKAKLRECKITDMLEVRIYCMVPEKVKDFFGSLESVFEFCPGYGPKPYDGCVV